MGKIRGRKHFRLMLLFKAVIYSIMSMHSYGITAEQTCRTTRAVQDHALTGHVITSLEGKRLDSCVISCELIQSCFSINYYTAVKKCELNKKTAEWYPSDLVSKSGAVYLSMVVRDYTPCVDPNPPCSGKCVPIPGSSATRCVCELGNAACKNDSCIAKPLGMEDGSIPDNKITASSTHSNSVVAWGRLNYSLGSWTPGTEDGYQWLQVNFEPDVKLITHIATQGNGKSWWWVKKYYVMFKKGQEALKEYMENNNRVKFQGNIDKDGVVKNAINHPFEADTVRIIPTANCGRIALRIELYGCDVIL